MIPAATTENSRGKPVSPCSVSCRIQLEAQESIRANPLLFMANNGIYVEYRSVAINSQFYCPGGEAAEEGGGGGGSCVSLSQSRRPIKENVLHRNSSNFPPPHLLLILTEVEQENPFQNPTILTRNYFYVAPLPLFYLSFRPLRSWPIFYRPPSHSPLPGHSVANMSGGGTLQCIIVECYSGRLQVDRSRREEGLC